MNLAQVLFEIEYLYSVMDIMRHDRPSLSDKKYSAENCKGMSHKEIYESYELARDLYEKEMKTLDAYHKYLQEQKTILEAKEIMSRYKVQ